MTEIFIKLLLSERPSGIILFQPLLVFAAPDAVHPRRIRQEPGDRAFQALCKVVVLFPSQLILYLVAVDRIPPVMTRTIAHERDQVPVPRQRPGCPVQAWIARDRAERFKNSADFLDHLDVLFLALSADIVGLPRRSHGQYLPDCIAMV